MAEAAPDPTDRFGGALRRLILLTFPSLRFFAVYEYALVSGTAGPTLTARCTDPGLGMPDLPPTKFYPSVDGSTATWTTPGTKFLVGFINGDPTRPYVIAGDPTQTPTTVTIAGGGPAAARVGDTVTITPGQFSAGTPVANNGGTMYPVTISSAILGTITTGSAKVSCG